MQKKKRVTIWFTVAFIIILYVIGFFLFNNSKNDNALNLSNLSDNKVISQGSYNKNVVFYNSATKQGQDEIPMAYTLDSLTFNHVQYRDVANPNNAQLQMNTLVEPEKVSINYTRKEPSFTNSRPLTHVLSPRVILFFVAYSALMILLSYALAVLVVKLCLGL